MVLLRLFLTVIKATTATTAIAATTISPMKPVLKLLEVFSGAPKTEPGTALGDGTLGFGVVEVPGL